MKYRCGVAFGRGCLDVAQDLYELSLEKSGDGNEINGNK